MLEVLKHTGRDKAVWIGTFHLSLFQRTRAKLTIVGHDWGCGSVWTFAAHYPEQCIAAAGMCVPYGIIELGRRIARGFRNFEHYRLRMLLITGGLDASPHTQL